MIFEVLSGKVLGTVIGISAATVLLVISLTSWDARIVVPPDGQPSPTGTPAHVPSLVNGECASDSDCPEYWDCNELRGVGKCICAETNDVRPVCGEDGVTYTNLSEARCKGVGIAHSGACSSPTSCGDGICAFSESCTGPDCVFCRQDCDVNQEICVCGNGICEDTGDRVPLYTCKEDSISCPQDCGVNQGNSVCGNGVCETKEVCTGPEPNCNFCRQDCGDPFPQGNVGPQYQ